MDLYSTRTLNGLVEHIRPVPSFFLSFFPEVLFHDTEEVYFDKVTDKPRIAPFVHPLLGGKLIQSLGYKTESVKPAYIKDKRVHDPSKPFKRLAGEALNGALTPQARLNAAIMRDLADQQRMLSRRLEIMAAEAVITGKLTIKGDGFDSIQINFGRDNNLTATLQAGEKWNAATAPDIGAQLEEFDGLLLEKCGYNASHLVLDRKAWKLMRGNEKLLKQLDLRRGTEGIAPQLAPMLTAEGVSFKGWYGDFPIFVYQHSYVDPSDGQTKQAMPDNTLVIVSQPGLQGVQHFGAIKDLDSLQATRSFTKSWTEQDPSARFLLMQSAPILVPYQTNASMTVTVV